MAKKQKFKLNEKRRARPKTPSARVPVLQDASDQPPFFIRGRKAGSKDEYWVSLALDRISKYTGWGWDYQVPVYGGRMRGGNVIDFLIYTPGMWTILDPMGRYWHTGAREDRMQMAGVARRKKWQLIAWFTDETPTRDAVYSFLKGKLHI